MVFLLDGIVLAQRFEPLDDLLDKVTEGALTEPSCSPKARTDWTCSSNCCCLLVGLFTHFPRNSTAVPVESLCYGQQSVHGCQTQRIRWSDLVACSGSIRAWTDSSEDPSPMAAKACRFCFRMERTKPLTVIELFSSAEGLARISATEESGLLDDRRAVGVRNL